MFLWFVFCVFGKVAKVLNMLVSKVFWGGRGGCVGRLLLVYLGLEGLGVFAFLVFVFLWFRFVFVYYCFVFVLLLVLFLFLFWGVCSVCVFFCFFS